MHIINSSVISYLLLYKYKTCMCILALENITTEPIFYKSMAEKYDLKRSFDFQGLGEKDGRK